jgi:hypothetical protein
VTAHYSPAFLAMWVSVEDLIRAADGEITPEARVAFRDGCLKLGHEERLRNLYRIRHKLTRQAEFFVPNRPQETYLKRRKGRDVCLKTRQQGLTTLSCIRALDYALWESGVTTGVMAHLQNVVGTIFEDIVKFSADYFKKDWGHLYSPTEKSDSSTTLAFKDDGIERYAPGHGRTLNTSMRVLYDFRGKTVAFLHVSEASRIEPERLLGSLQGVPANGEVILESTPNGQGGEFYRLWQLWRKMGELAPYRGHFFPWYEHYPECPDDWRLPEGEILTPYEKQMQRDLPDRITEAHIAWRRWCIEANCQGEPDLFENEYPSNDEDCFLTGQNQVFTKELLKRMLKTVRPPSRVGFLLSDGALVKFHDDEKGHVLIWEEPEIGAEYVGGSDAAGGVGRDKAVTYILKKSTGAVVACIAGQLDPNDFAKETLKAALYYNKAWLCPEANNHGHVVIHVLKTAGYRNLYKRKVLDDVSNKVSTQFGFLTTNDSKLSITEKLKTAIKEGKFQARDNDLVVELSTFVQVASKQGKSIRREATPGNHDDRVMAAALAIEMLSQRGVTSSDEEDSAGPPDSDESFDPDTGLMAS